MQKQIQKSKVRNEGLLLSVKVTPVCSIVRFLKTCEWPTGGYGGEQFLLFVRQTYEKSFLQIHISIVGHESV